MTKLKILEYLRISPTMLKVEGIIESSHPNSFMETPIHKDMQDMLFTTLPPSKIGDSRCIKLSQECKIRMVSSFIKVQGKDAPNTVKKRGQIKYFQNKIIFFFSIHIFNEPLNRLLYWPTYTFGVIKQQATVGPIMMYGTLAK